MGQTNPIYTYKVEKSETGFTVQYWFKRIPFAIIKYREMIECSDKPLSKALIQRN